MPEKSCTDCYEPDLMKCAACARNPKGVEIDPVKKTMSDIKEKLVELYNKLEQEGLAVIAGKSDMADLMIANGVTFATDNNVGDKQNQADRIRAMNDEALAEFLCGIAYTGREPWSEPFAQKFCQECPAPEYTLDDGRKLNLHECEFADGKCPHGSDAVWWLQQPAEEVDHE